MTPFDVVDTGLTKGGVCVFLTLVSNLKFWIGHYDVPDASQKEGDLTVDDASQGERNMTADDALDAGRKCS